MPTSVCSGATSAGAAAPGCRHRWRILRDEDLDHADDGAEETEQLEMVAMVPRY